MLSHRSLIFSSSASPCTRPLQAPDRSDSPGASASNPLTPRQAVHRLATTLELLGLGFHQHLQTLPSQNDKQIASYANKQSQTVSLRPGTAIEPEKLTRPLCTKISAVRGLSGARDFANPHTSWAATESTSFLLLLLAASVPECSVMPTTSSHRHRHRSANRAQETPPTSSASSSSDSSFSDDEEARIGSTPRAGGKQWTMHSVVNLSCSGVRAKSASLTPAPETEQRSRR